MCLRRAAVFESRNLAAWALERCDIGPCLDAGLDGAGSTAGGCGDGSAGRFRLRGGGARAAAMHSDMIMVI